MALANIREIRSPHSTFPRIGDQRSRVRTEGGILEVRGFALAWCVARAAFVESTGQGACGNAKTASCRACSRLSLRRRDKCPCASAEALGRIPEGSPPYSYNRASFGRRSGNSPDTSCSIATNGWAGWAMLGAAVGVRRHPRGFTRAGATAFRAARRLIFNPDEAA